MFYDPRSFSRRSSNLAHDFGIRLFGDAHAYRDQSSEPLC
jgi:hypothetical protein